MLCSTRPAPRARPILACYLAVLAVTGCGSSTDVNVAGPSITRCGISISGTSSPAPASGGTGTLTLTTARECAWSARSEASWISLSSTDGQGPANLGYSILPNPNGTLRRGSVAVEDQRVEIAQDPAPCRYDLSPASVDLGASSGAVELNLVAPGGCAWTIRPSAPWLSPEPSSGGGATTVRLEVASNPGPARTGNVSIGATMVAVRQAANTTAPSNCTSRIEPVRQTTPPSGEAFALTMTTAPGCAWTAVSDVSWITVMEGGSGTGNGIVRLQTQPSSGTARTGTVRVGGATLTVDQGAGSSTPACSYSLNSASRTVGASADDVTLEVRAERGCAWSASSRAGWITVRSGDSGTGDGSVRLAVATNTSQSARTGTVVIAGATFTIEQAGAQACSYTIKPTNYNAGRGPDDIKIEVRSTAACPWSATSIASWVSVAEGAAGVGNGNVRLLVQGNSGGPRTTTLTIAGQPFTLSQEGACQATIKPTDHKAGAGSDDVKVQVKVNDNCSWTSSSPVPWATITEGAAQSGNATVRIRIDANPGAGRSATLIIAGERFTLTQEASKK
jgi:hypothetical protein